MNDVFNSVAESIKENCPKLMIGIGVGSMIVGGVWACVKTHKELPKAIDEFEKAEEDLENRKNDISEDEYKKARKEMYISHGKNVVKIYAGPVVMVVAGSALIFVGQHLIWVRLATATALVETYSEMYQRLKKGVDENFGEGTSEKIILGGKIKKAQNIKNAEWIFPEDPFDMYTFDFTQGNLEWVNDRKLLWDKLSRMQEEYTALMSSRLVTGPFGVIERPGYLFLAEVLQGLCIEPADEGKVDIAQNAGWIFDPTDTLLDNEVDFGLDNPRNSAFFFEPGSDPKEMRFRKDPIDHNDLLYLNFNCMALISKYLNPNSPYRVEITKKPKTKKVTTTEDGVTITNF